MAPTFKAAGAFQSGGAVALTVPWPAGHAVGDWGYLVVYNAGANPALTTANGFTEFASQSPQSTTALFLAVYECRATSTSMASPVTATGSNNCGAVIVTAENALDAASAIEVIAGQVKATASTSTSITGPTTTEDDQLMFFAAGRGSDQGANQYSGEANSNVTGIAERVDNGTITGNGGGIGIWTGTKATAGATGPLTANLANTSAEVYISWSVRSAVSTQALTGTLFQKAPTFFTGAVGTGTVNLAGTLFTKAPTFFGGTVATVAGQQDLTGTLFTKAPTFFAGAIASGFVGGLPSAAVIGVWDARAHPGADTDPVASWADLGPLGQDPLAQATSGFRPLIDDSGFGGIRSILFDGVDNRLDTTLDQTYAVDFAFIVVLELLTYPTGSAAVAYSTGAIPNKNILGVDDVEDPPGWVVMSGPDGTQAEHHHGNVIDLEDVPVRVVMTQLVRNSGIHKLWERAVLVIDESDSAGGDDLNDLQALKVGAREDNSRFMNYRLAYVLLVDMTETDETTLLLARDELGSQFAVPDMDAQAVFGVLFQKAPTFFAGALTAGPVDLAGNLFQKAPTFFAGDVTVGAVDLAGVLFEKAPTFFGGTVTSGAFDLVGVLFEKAPTFFTGAVTTGAVGLTGTLFQQAPTFFTGALTAGAANLTGVLFQKAPTFFAGTVVGGQTLVGVLFQKAPVFFVGTLTEPAEPSTNWPVSTNAGWDVDSDDGWPVSTESEWQGV
jgi:hypothetical protein